MDIQRLNIYDVASVCLGVDESIVVVLNIRHERKQSHEERGRSACH